MTICGKLRRLRFWICALLYVVLIAIYFHLEFLRNEIVNVTDVQMPG